MNSQSGNVSVYRPIPDVSQDEAGQAAWRELAARLGWLEGRADEVPNSVKYVNKAVAEYNRELNKALLTLDEQKIRKFYISRHGQDLHPDKEIFWVSIHKAITGRKSLPFAFRKASKDWLAQRNQHSLDDGELNFPVDENDTPF